MEPVPLKRSLSLPLITLYGLGTIVGAGIYVLIGEVAGKAGMSAPLSFLLASLLVATSAFSYAELSARYPLCAGEALYVQHAFGWTLLARLVGLGVVLIGIVSTATLIRGFVGYLHVFIELPPVLIICLLVVILGGLAAWGITESVTVAAVTTLIEIVGLLLIVWVGRGGWHLLPERLPDFFPSMTWQPWLGILAGTFLAFYAYIGFEDIVNVAEEVKRPSRNLPLAVFLSLGISTLLYMVVVVSVLLSVTPEELAQSEAPLAYVYQRSTGQEPVFIALASLTAVLNGALIQIIMATRVLYGMSRQSWLPGLFARVNPLTRTPLNSTLVIVAAVLALALWLPLVRLAEITSLITLLVFSTVNLSLWRVKRHEPRPEGVQVYPGWLPIIGAVSSLGLVVLQLGQWM